MIDQIAALLVWTIGWISALFLGLGVVNVGAWLANRILDRWM